MKIAHKITIGGSSPLVEHFLSLGITHENVGNEMLGDLYVFDVTESDPNWPVIAERLAQHDINFYMHELKESAIMQNIADPRAAHLQTLEWQGIPYRPGYESQIYHPSVIQQFPEYFNPAAWPQ